MPIEPEKPLPVSSSKPPVFSPGQEDLFREVLGLMNRNRIQYVVAGGFALHEHTGIWRDTKDLDLFMPAQEVCKALRLLQQDGFETEIKDSVWLAKARRGDFFVDMITGMSNAVVRVDYSWIKRGVHSEVFGIAVRVLAPEELIASKIFVTRRERFDGADICHVLYGTKGKLDWRRLLHLLGEQWEMLFWSMVLYHYVYPAFGHYVPREIWDELLQRFRTELDYANPALPFRGSLIDEKMFAIDVEEWGMRNVIDEYRQTADIINSGEERAA